MGARLVGRAIDLALPQVRTHAARTILLVMAHRAKDTDQSPQYFGGSAYLALRLGYALESPTGERAVRRAIGELVDLGYIEQIPGLPRHHKRRWMLKLPGAGPAPGGNVATIDLATITAAPEREPGLSARERIAFNGP